MIVSSDITEQKKADEKLNESERFNRAVVENSPLGVSVRSRDGTLLSSNKAWSKIWRNTDSEIDEMMTKKRTELKFDSNDSYLGKWIPEVKRIYEQGGELHVPDAEVVDPREGAALWVSQYFYAIRSGDGKVDRVVILTEDVTERKTAYEKLRDSEQQFRSLSENLPGMIYRGSPHWSVEFHSNTEEISGFTTEEFNKQKKKWLDIIHPDDRERVLSESEELNILREPAVQEYRIIAKDGGVRWIEDHKMSRFTEEGEFLGVDGVAFDITERKLIEQKLLESEDKFRTTLESSPDAIAVIELDRTVSLCNQAALQLFGYRSKDEVIGKSVFEFFAPEDHHSLAENMEKTLLTGALKNIEYTMLTKSNHRFQGEVSASLIKDIAGLPTAIVGIIKDISERKRQEAALRESEEKFRVIAESTPIPVVISRQSDGKILFANSLIAPAFKYTDEELKNISSAVFYDDLDDLLKVEKMIETGPVRNYEAKARRSDGTTFWVTLSQDKIMFSGEDAYLGAFYDITEQRMMIEALREGEAKFRDLADLLPQTIYEADTKGIITFTNRHGLESTGYTQKDFDKGVNILKLFSGTDIERARERVLRILRGEQLEAAEYNLVRKDGSTYPVITYSTRILSGGVPVGLRGIVIDITERKRVEDELLEANEELRTERSKLEKANIALHEVLGAIEDRRKEVTKRVNTNMERLVQPVLESLKRKSSEESSIIIENLERTLKELTSPFTRDLETRISRLTPREIQICDMIRGGMRSGEIASSLDISELTVQKFRQQIRRKLGINKKKINLATHLCSMSYKRLSHN